AYAEGRGAEKQLHVEETLSTIRPEHRSGSPCTTLVHRNVPAPDAAESETGRNGESQPQCLTINMYKLHGGQQPTVEHLREMTTAINRLCTVLQQEHATHRRRHHQFM
ncbi:hypothetical protein NDU88_002852, partial [Pleurodeles waltl]